MSNAENLWERFVIAIQERTLNPGPVAEYNVKFWADRLKAALTDDEAV